MKQYEAVFFSMLRKSLWGCPLDIPEGFRDWKYVLGFAKHQWMHGFVADAMLTTPEIVSKISPRGIERLQNIPLDNMAQHTTLNNTLILVVNALRAEGIEPVLMKGQGLAHYYPVPGLRTCGDIDLYVGLENYEKAYYALQPLATEIDTFSQMKGDGRHFHLSIGTAILEIHKYSEVYSSPRKNNIYQEYASKGLTENLVPVALGPLTVNTPADDFNVFYVFSHLWHHFMASGIGLRQLCDFVCLLHAKVGKCDLEQLECMLRKMGLMTPWKVVGCALVEYFGLPEQEYPFYDKSYRRRGQRFFNYVLKDEFAFNNPFAREARRGFLREKLFSLKCHLKRFFGLVFIFPVHTINNFLHTIAGGLRRAFRDYSDR